MRHAARRDVAEEAIVETLRNAGAIVRHLSGKDLPDLAVLFAGRVFLCEVKTGKAKLRPGQELFRLVAKTAGVTVHVVRNPNEALAVLARGDS